MRLVVVVIMEGNVFVLLGLMILSIGFKYWCAILVLVCILVKLKMVIFVVLLFVLVVVGIVIRGLIGLGMGSFFLMGVLMYVKKLVG